jgi:hypothetical protein
MKVSAHLALWAALVFALVCFYVAWTGFSSLDDLAGDPQAQSDARGFAWFWLLLAGVAVAAGVASWWIVRNDPQDR